MVISLGLDLQMLSVILEFLGMDTFIIITLKRGIALSGIAKCSFPEKLPEVGSGSMLKIFTTLSTHHEKSEAVLGHHPMLLCKFQLLPFTGK